MKLTCPSCSKVLNCPDHLAGKAGQCPKCGGKFRIPTPPPAPPPPPSLPPPPPRDLIPVREPPSPPPDLIKYEPPTQQSRAKPEPAKSQWIDPTPVGSGEPDIGGDCLYYDEFVTIWHDGSAEFRINSPAEGKLAVKALRLVKKEINVALKEVNASLREVRHNYTAYTRQRGPMMRGGGKFGMVIRTIQSISREVEKGKLASNIQPLHEQQEKLRSLINAIDRLIIRIEALMLRM